MVNPASTYDSSAHADGTDSMLGYCHKLLQNLPVKTRTPMTTKAAPATRLIHSSGKYWPSALPTITPIAETAASAIAAPRKTSHGRFFSAAMVMAAIWVLSP